MGSHTCPIRWLYSISMIALISLANYVEQFYFILRKASRYWEL
jgi:hypothetical protein